MTVEEKVSNRIDIYYAVLAVAMIALAGRGEVLLPNVFRIVFMILTIIPVISHREYLSWVVLMFLGVSLVSFSPVFPTDSLYYFPIVAALEIFTIRNNRNCNTFLNRRFVCVLLVLFCLFSLIHFQFPHYIFPVILSTLLVCSINDKRDVIKLLEGLVYSSLILSLMFILYRNQFEVDYGGSQVDLQRTGWINPNVYGLYVAGGSILATSALLNYIPYGKNSVTNVILYVSCFLGGIVLSLNASRGAFLSWGICVALMVLLSNIKSWYKVVFSVLLVLSAYWLLRSGSIALLLYRFQEDSIQTGGGRLDIWQMKIHAFFSESSPLELLFGLGKEECDNLVNFISTHNDVVTSLVAFGFIGVICYLCFLMYPFLKVKIKKKTVYILSLFLVIESFTQEPVFRGELSFIMFYIAVFFISQLPEINEK